MVGGAAPRGAADITTTKPSGTAKSKKIKLPTLNPNWAQLQQKLKSRAPAGVRLRPPSKANSVAAEDESRSVLGKRKGRSGANLDSEATLQSVLAPVSDDFSLTKALAMDCEMVGVSTDGTKSALGRVTLVNVAGNVVYDEYVRPVERIVDFRTKISGIRPKDLRKAKELWVVQKEVAEMIKGRILVGHALHNDLKVLLLSHPKKDIRDTSAYQPLQSQCRNGRKRALKDIAADVLGIMIQQKEHCPIEDARAVLLIYKKYRNEWEKSLKNKSRFKTKLKNKLEKKAAGDGTEEHGASSTL